MISLELAEKLKNAGLIWKPQKGDNVFLKNLINEWKTEQIVSRVFPHTVQMNGWGQLHTRQFKDCLFRPRLDQLLAEIERQGYWYKQGNAIPIPSCPYKYYCEIWQTNKSGEELCYHEFAENSPEEAVGQALLWILEQEAIKNGNSSI